MIRLQSCLMAVIVLAGGGACSAFSGPALDCDFPTLAAGSDMHVALSCVEGVVYHDTEYFVGCAPVHRSRVGDAFLDDGGETRFTGAKDARGMSRSEVFLIEGGDPGECPKKERLIAVSESFSRLDAGLLRVPTDAENQERLARERAPWIVPGRNEFPHALELDAVLSEDGITVTNRNEFTWRNCDQIQVNDEADELWETGDYLDSLKAGASHTWPLNAFGRDHHGLEDLSQDALDEIRGKPFIIMCRAPRGRAFGRDVL